MSIAKKFGCKGIGHKNKRSVTEKWQPFFICNLLNYSYLANNRKNSCKNVWLYYYFVVSLWRKTNTMENQTEIWKPIEGFPDYEVSDLGRVRSLKFGKIKVLQAGLNSRGYYKVLLMVGGLRKDKTVHRLVADAFLGASELFIDHIDGIKTNNNLSNLRYCTQRENVTYHFLSAKTSSKYTGVAWIENRKKWFARIYINKQIYLGYFTDEKQAAKAYQTALEMHEVGEVVTGAMVRQKISN